ncbi:MAG: Gfo/Idh/MocA family oxidoreductase [Candidatus Manganitrophus sp.]|nr:MAG: Gfo/Idh/MocA family oxidoreductase [Candidatus Manganitrophus sp.]
MEGAAPYLGIVVSYPGQEKAKPNRVVHLRKGSRSGRVQLGIIGAGSHVKDRLLPVLSGIKEVSLRAVCTASGIHAKALGEKIAAAYCASDYRDVLKDEEINAVLIGTRHGDHGQMVVESLRAGKHVFVEKPLCLSEEALEEITAVYEAKATEGIQLMVGFNRRFSPHMAQARALFQDRKNPLVMLYRVNAGAISPDHWVHDPEIGGGRILGGGLSLHRLHAGPLRISSDVGARAPDRSSHLRHHGGSEPPLLLFRRRLHRHGDLRGRRRYRPGEGAVRSLRGGEGGDHR